MVALSDRKDEAAREIKTWARQIKQQFGKMPKEFHTDQGTEFRNQTLKEFWEAYGVRATFSLVNTPQHNGKVERLNRTIGTITGVNMRAAKAPHPLWAEAERYSLWAEAERYSLVLYNRRPRSDGRPAPIQLLTGRSDPPRIDHLRVWGCTAYVKMPMTMRRDKFDPTAVQAVFVGLAEPTGYRFLIPSDRMSVFETRHATFVENDFNAMQKVRQ